MFKSKKAAPRKGSSLSSHIFWGALSGVAAVWVAKQYRKALPDQAREKLDETVESLSPMAGYESPTLQQHSDVVPYAVGAGAGVLYGISTFYFPVIQNLRKLLFGLAAWSFRLTKLASLTGAVEDSRDPTLAERVTSLASRRAYKFALDQTFKRAER